MVRSSVQVVVIIEVLPVGVVVFAVVSPTLVVVAPVVFRPPVGVVVAVQRHTKRGTYGTFLRQRRAWCCPWWRH